MLYADGQLPSGACHHSQPASPTGFHFHWLTGAGWRKLVCRFGVGVELGARIWPEHIRRLRNMECSQIWEYNCSLENISAEVQEILATPAFQRLFSTSPSNFLPLVQGVPARLHQGEDSPLVRLPRLPSHFHPHRYRIERINSQKGRTHAEGHSGYNWLPKHTGNNRVAWRPSNFTFKVGQKSPGISASPTETVWNPTYDYERAVRACVTFTAEPSQSEPDSRLNKKRRLEKFKHNLLLGNNKLTLLHFVGVTLQNISTLQRARFYVIKTAKKRKKGKGTKFCLG